MVLECVKVIHNFVNLFMENKKFLQVDYVVCRLQVISFFAAFAYTHARGKLHSRENNLLTKQTMQGGGAEVYRWVVYFRWAGPDLSSTTNHVPRTR